jgi:hypothetical protein
VASDQRSKSPRDNHGPLVKTGPTAGKNRSRNDDGRWRGKRSDAGRSRSSKKSGCFVTTAVCEYKGLPDDCEQLTVLRRFRDDYLAALPGGQSLVERYYELAPRLVERLKDPADLERAWNTIQRCVRVVQEGRPDEALCLYTQELELMSKTLRP